MMSSVKKTILAELSVLRFRVKQQKQAGNFNKVAMLEKIITEHESVLASLNVSVPDAITPNDTHSKMLAFAKTLGYKNVAKAISDMGSVEFREAFKIGG